MSEFRKHWRDLFSNYFISKPPISNILLQCRGNETKRTKIKSIDEKIIFYKGHVLVKVVRAKLVETWEGGGFGGKKLQTSWGWAVPGSGQA